MHRLMDWIESFPRFKRFAAWSEKHQLWVPLITGIYFGVCLAVAAWRGH